MEFVAPSNSSIQLSRNTFNQMIRLRITEGELTNTEYLNADFGKANETMKLRRTHEGSYAIISATETQKLEFAAFYSKDSKVKDRLLEKASANAGVKGLRILQVC